MKETIATYLRYLKIERNASEHTLASYQNDLRQLLDFTARQFETEPEEVNISHIDRLTIRLWMGELTEDGFARNSIARKVACVRSFFKYCFKRGHIEKNPAHLLIVPRKEKRLPKTVHLEEINRMMDLACGDDPHTIQEKAILELFYSTGIRLSELTSINLSDINNELKQITVTGKGNKQRTVPIGQKAFEALRSHLKKRLQLGPDKNNPDAQKALFIAPRGARINARKVQRIIKKYLLKVSEVTQKSPHTLRHSFATHMLDSGADIRMIKEFLGHANLASTQVYTHTSVERLQKIYSKAHPRAEL